MPPPCRAASRRQGDQIKRWGMIDRLKLASFGNSPPAVNAWKRQDTQNDPADGAEPHGMRLRAGWNLGN